MTRPNHLKEGDKIGIISTARKISDIELQPAITKLQEWGFEVVLGNNLFQEHHQFAGTDEQRAADLQKMMDNDSVKAIICARGGYGTVRIIDKLDFSKFKQHPKWLIGYSDVTVLHSYIHEQLNIETLHATMPINFPEKGGDSASTEGLRKFLFGEITPYEFNTHTLNRSGNCEGVLVGGNLSILYALRGTNIDIDTKGKILFIEDLDEYLYHIDRIMTNLKLGGKLSLLKGLVIGGMSDMNDNQVPFGKNACEIIAEAVAEYDYPVCFNFPAGHKEPNMPLIMGRDVKLEVSSTGSCLTFDN